MTVLRLRWVHRFRDRHGKMRFYFRRPGYPNMALPGLPGSAEFREAYEAALAGEALPIGAGRTVPGSLSALAVAYYRSAEFVQLAPVTQATYRNLIEGLRAQHGDKPVKLLQREHVRRLVSAKAATPSAANAVLKVLRILMRMALDDGWRRDDPTVGVRRLRTDTEGFRTWSEAEISTFEERWPVGSRQRLAFALLLYTGQRVGDVIRLGRQNQRENGLEIRQRKTGMRLLIPIHPHLSEVLATVPAGQLVFLLTAEGKPFTDGGINNWMRSAREAAGLPERLSSHGLRKAAARRLAEAGCTAHEIMAVGGWRTLKEVSRYTQAADQARLARAAIASIETRRKSET